jgi:FMN phosphatase YigB (HAD superfamily)
MIKAIIFDCFGVVFSDNFEDNYRKFGGDPVKDKQFLEEVIFTLSTGKEKNFNRIIASRLNIAEDVWSAANTSGRRFNWELLKYITQLRKTYKVSMLSNIGNDGLETFMDYSILEQHFDDIVESAKIGFAKPEARAYEVAADRLHVRLDECIFIDDREKYVEGATHVGMKAILFEDLDSLKQGLESILARDA